MVVRHKYGLWAKSTEAVRKFSLKTNIKTIKPQFTHLNTPIEAAS